MRRGGKHLGIGGPDPMSGNAWDAWGGNGLRVLVPIPLASVRMQLSAEGFTDLPLRSHPKVRGERPHLLPVNYF